MRAAIGIRLATLAILAALAAQAAWGNGGPFIVKSPGGDPAAKGVLARLDPSLKPGREERLRVVHEDLTIRFDRAMFPAEASPLVHVAAAYTIENPSEQEVRVDFGFPILRGIYMSPLAMLPRPDVQVTVDGKGVVATVLSNSVIYGVLRQQARATIEKGIAADAHLATLVGAVRRAAGLAAASPAVQTSQQAVSRQRPAGSTEELARARQAVRDYLTGGLNWNQRDASLLAEYAGLDLGPARVFPYDRTTSNFLLRSEKELAQLSTANLGVLSAIGEQKATQLFARLAMRFDKQAIPAYEAIFASWGGDVRERAVDLSSGEVRPRQFDLAPSPGKTSGDPRALALFGGDPTVYVRIDYLDPRAKLSDAEQDSCRAVLKNLPVVFTFAPMNLLHYQVTFAAKAKQVVSVEYRQYAFADTRDPASYQIAYVLHPATLWDDFGPIRLKVYAPKGIPCRASVGLARDGAAAAAPPNRPMLVPREKAELEGYAATLVEKSEKRGELFVAVEKAAWDARFKPPVKATANAPAGK